MCEYQEDQFLPISALQHLLYCERQYALIHVEQIWSENLFTARGAAFHNRAHEGKREVRGETVFAFGLPVRSYALGVTGITDAVELRHTDRTLSELEMATPVEYKVGRPKRGLCDRVQLAAQALCLEEMLQVPVAYAYVYYGTTRRRLEVLIDEALRAETHTAALRIHELMVSGHTPAPEYAPGKCDKCSLFDICKPRAITQRSASAYLQAAVRRSLQD